MREEVGDEVRKEVGICGRGEFFEVAPFEIDLLTDEDGVEQNEVASCLCEGHLVEVLTLLHAPGRDVLGNGTG